MPLLAIKTYPANHEPNPVRSTFLLRTDRNFHPMTHCTPKHPIPCVRYTGHNQAELDAFLLANGGQPATYQANGQADIATLLKGQTKLIYCKPGSWLRRLDEGQFAALSNKVFTQTYQLLESQPDLLAEASQEVTAELVVN